MIVGSAGLPLPALIKIKTDCRRIMLGFFPSKPRHRKRLSCIVAGY
jgi:hypothetical protein